MGNSDYVSHKITAALGALYKVMETGNPPDIQLLLFLKVNLLVLKNYISDTKRLQCLPKCSYFWKNFVVKYYFCVSGQPQIWKFYTIKFATTNLEIVAALVIH